MQYIHAWKNVKRNNRKKIKMALLKNPMELNWISTPDFQLTNHLKKIGKKCTKVTQIINYND